MDGVNGFLRGRDGDGLFGRPRTMGMFRIVDFPLNRSFFSGRVCSELSRLARRGEQNLTHRHAGRKAILGGLPRHVLKHGC
jgi:hypothetical protein